MSDIHKIFKYPIEVTDEQILRLPAGSQILSVIEQRNEMVLYAMVPHPNDYPEVYVEYDIRVVGTGHDVKFSTRDFTFVGTVSMYKGGLVFHVFYRKGNLMGPDGVI
jgi:hypothetical protein